MDEIDYEKIRPFFEKSIPYGFVGKDNDGDYYLSNTQGRWISFKYGYALRAIEEQDDGK